MDPFILIKWTRTFTFFYLILYRNSYKQTVKTLIRRRRLFAYVPKNGMLGLYWLIKQFYKNKNKLIVVHTPYSSLMPCNADEKLGLKLLENVIETFSFKQTRAINMNNIAWQQNVCSKCSKTSKHAEYESPINTIGISGTLQFEKEFIISVY